MDSKVDDEEELNLSMLLGELETLVVPEFDPSDYPNSISVEELGVRCMTGDLLLFSGPQKIGRLIRFISRSKFSHAMMMLRNADGEVSVLHSSVGAYHDVILDGEMSFAATVTDLNETMQLYIDTDMHDAPELGIWLHFELPEHMNQPEERQFRFETLMEFIADVHGAKYRFNPLDIYVRGRLLNAKKSQGDGHQNNNWFCSEIVAEALMRMGLMKQGIRQPHSFSPGDFDQLRPGGEFEHLLVDGVKLSEPLLVTTKRFRTIQKAIRLMSISSPRSFPTVDQDQIDNDADDILSE